MDGACRVAVARVAVKFESTVKMTVSSRPQECSEFFSLGPRLRAMPSTPQESLARSATSATLSLEAPDESTEEDKPQRATDRHRTKRHEPGTSPDGRSLPSIKGVASLTQHSFEANQRVIAVVPRSVQARPCDRSFALRA